MGEDMKRWKVTVTLESQIRKEGVKPEPVDVTWCKAVDELSAVESVIQNMRHNDEWSKVTKITVEPV